MKGDITAFACHVAMGALITQVLLLALSVQCGLPGAGGPLQNLGAVWESIAGQLTTTQLVLFGLFDCAGGLGFSALAHGRMTRLFAHS
ncbi:MAG: hypothetical protein QCH35_04465 [Methanomicrobiaceae archaeon]|nr:hypothetical protein [Methanomicrobiaceae archaeon]